jgi:hypothetical protein
MQVGYYVRNASLFSLLMGPSLQEVKAGLALLCAAHASGSCHTPGFNYMSAIFLWHVCRGATLDGNNNNLQFEVMIAWATEEQRSRHDPTGRLGN